MDLIFINEPIIGVITLVIIMLDILSCLVRKKGIITAVNLILHAVCLTLIMLLGGGYEGALILVLISCIITLIGTPRPDKESEDDK